MQSHPVGTAREAVSGSMIRARSVVVDALAVFTHAGTDTTIDGSGKRIRYVVDGRSMDEEDFLQMAHQRMLHRANADQPTGTG